ncbi:hypothetical protein GCM10009647_083740 [Streptomyces sanglieri]|uniref:Uncharacterized protein n=1 Tax=Streptomyces sanglieri TaxID=193460 RepID=A0ABW2WP98_9ACTN|nr:hypothetical protein [Streptomyces sp. Wh19]MDV9198449.1 hypothetical protein [Streptomyces sp. Wh19]
MGELVLQLPHTGHSPNYRCDVARWGRIAPVQSVENAFGSWWSGGQHELRADQAGMLTERS